MSYSLGVGLGLAGVPIWVAPFSAPIQLLARPRSVDAPMTVRAVLAACLVAGLFAGAGAALSIEQCVGPPLGKGTVQGRFLVTPRAGSAPFEETAQCRPFTVVVAHSASAIELPIAGRRLWFEAVSWTSVGPERSVGLRASARWIRVRWRDRMVGKIHDLYGPHAPLVSALVLARREGLPSEVRDGFAAAGIAHLLAISGFHVGIIAGFFIALLRSARVTRPVSVRIATCGTWAYVALIGFPDAACRAALIMTLIVAARGLGHPPSRWGPLAAAAVILLLHDPMRLSGAGFQLSFAGAAGLVAWSRPTREALERHPWRAWVRAPVSLVKAVSAGVAATVATLPVVAWHFEDVSLVGIPMTLVSTPLIAMALPGALITILVDVFSHRTAIFVSGGVTLLLDGVTLMSGAVASQPWSTTFVPRPVILAVLAGCVIAAMVARQPRIGSRVRRRLCVLYVGLAVCLWPTLLAIGERGELELWMIDVGQGDAFALRTPRGRWILVDAGPPQANGSRGHPVLRAFRARGVRSIETLILTHADADHYGGAEAVLRGINVGRVVDPALSVGKVGYADALDAAREVGTPWYAARTGDELGLDGVRVQVLHPSEAVMIGESNAALRGEGEINSTSVVLLVSWNGFDALLTGDAYVETELTLMDEVGDVDVLKVGHHGSRTSTDSSFLAANRYGHPVPEVVGRLTRVGAKVYRTDRQGDVHVIVSRSGRITVRSSRPLLD
ncbi:MAG: DNA internalization-related competence protein ComEC/Rec2 [Longimicrobiales bacterium]